MDKKPGPQRVAYYFLREKKVLAITTVSGLLYNVGLVLAPWFEGQLAQYIADILGGSRAAKDLVLLSLAYVLSIFFVQAMRYVKRLYVRRFANETSLLMKQVIYRHLIRLPRKKLLEKGTGSLMTRVISDVDACVEGMRKFTTEIFDTGVVMVAYTAMLLYYDWRLTVLVLLFPPAAYILAGKLKKVITTAGRLSKESAGRLSSATVDRIGNALTYRIFGEEKAQNSRYEENLKDYEKKMIRSNLWENTMEPLYQVIAMTGAIFILWLGGKNVMGSGWTDWNIAAFATFLSCFTHLAVKSSHAAHLFNAVQKAEVSWARIHGYLSDIPEKGLHAESPAELDVRDVSFTHPDGEKPVIRNFSLTAKPGEIIGVTGKVASGKSTLGRLFLAESPYTGSITWGGRELGKEIAPAGLVSYMGHDPELLSATIEDNIRLGKPGNLEEVLRAADLEKDIASFPEGIHTAIGEGGIRLSGGQQARIALARALYHRRPLLILDDPFSAVDYTTENHILTRLRPLLKDSIVILISHRLRFFPSRSQVLWVGPEGKVDTSTHEKLMKTNEDYRKMYSLQNK